jgi:hypothetical protein
MTDDLRARMFYDRSDGQTPATQKELDEATATLSAGLAADIAALTLVVDGKADAGDLPVLSDTDPLALGAIADPGISDEVSRADHVHEGDGQRHTGTTDAGGLVAWTFPVPYGAPPFPRTIIVHDTVPRLTTITVLDATDIEVACFDIAGVAIGAGVPVYIEVVG